MFIKTKLYKYNIDAIRSEGKDEDSINLSYMLGYIDFTNMSNVEAMLNFADEENYEDYSYEKDVTIEFKDYNIEALNQGLEIFNLNIESIEPLRLSKMIAYALGFIDYSLNDY